ncbi:aprataxin and PNK-like factor [Hyla sarda]|uniref:aprataxin and PNK-like factor n=1 Tax=Hyla sarda TaxID=327740 RepID=UPI0024C23197|nr:aprataxin and PNK-like factor [Hyla sarda]
MSGYQLEATDGSGRHNIPVGETVLGRGALLGIADKRISRSHAVLEVVDDKLRMKSIHVNPCFYQASGKSTFEPLQRNEWRWLHPGDCIAFLPDKYFYRVIAENLSEDATLRNSQGYDEECELNENSPCPPVNPETSAKSFLQEPSSLSATSNTKNNGKLCNDVPSAVTCQNDVEPAKPAQRKRVLPNWMLQGDLPLQALPSHVLTAVKKKRIVTQRTQTTPQSSKDEDSSAKRPSAVSLPTTSATLKKTVTPGNLQKGHVVDNEEVKMEEDYTQTLPSSPPSNISPPESPCASDNKPSASRAVSNDNISLSPVSSQQSQPSQKKRTPCMYGEKCYRKNPVHFQEFSHPGDSDYCDVENGSQDDSDDRPECPYGTDCYRKNPQHKLEYKHTKPPGRKLRKRNPKKAKRSALDGDSDDDGEGNEYDLEDSFIDDDEEEDFDFTDEDSDWMPDSEDKNSEDMKDLLREAKQFVRGKR